MNLSISPSVISSPTVCSVSSLCSDRVRLLLVHLVAREVSREPSNLLLYHFVIISVHLPGPEEAFCMLASRSELLVPSCFFFLYYMCMAAVNLFDPKGEFFGYRCKKHKEVKQKHFKILKPFGRFFFKKHKPQNKTLNSTECSLTTAAAEKCRLSLYPLCISLAGRGLRPYLS